MRWGVNTKMEKRERVNVSCPTEMSIEQCKKIASESRKVAARRTEMLREWLREQAISSYTDYQNSGKHLTGKEASDFLRSGKTGELPECHR